MHKAQRLKIKQEKNMREMKVYRDTNKQTSYKTWSSNGEDGVVQMYLSLNFEFQLK